MSSNIFKNEVTANIGTSPEVVYEAPTGKTSTIIGMSLANTLVGDITCDVTLTDFSTSTTVYIIKGVPIPSGSSFIPIGKDQKVVIEDGDYISVTSSDASSIDAIVSVMELATGV